MTKFRMKVISVEIYRDFAIFTPTLNAVNAPTLNAASLYHIICMPIY